MGRYMNRIVMFDKKVPVDFGYIRTGDIYRSVEYDRLKVFICGAVDNYRYIASLRRYRVELKILFYDLRDKVFREEKFSVFSADLHKIILKIVGVYRSTH